MRYPFVRVKNGDTYHSDHRPVIIDTEEELGERCRRGGDRAFKFEAAWLQEEDCRRVVQEVWEDNASVGRNLGESIRGVAASLNEWSTNSLGDLEKRLKNARKELEKWRRGPISDLSVSREAVWCFKVDRLEEQIDLYWKQRAYVDWLRFGDRNTTYFHNACSARRRRNRIGRLVRDDGSWVEGEEEKRSLFLTILCICSGLQIPVMQGKGSNS